MEANRTGEEQRPVPHSTPKVFDIAKRGLGFVLDNWLVVGFGLAAVLGYFFPRTYRLAERINSEVIR